MNPAPCAWLRVADSRKVPHLEGQGDLVSKLRRRITRVTIWVIGAILSKSPQPSK